VTREQTDYLRRREQQERAAAKAALSVAARRVHQHLAESYSALLQGEDPSDPISFLRRNALV
jgi:hypothetical protein